MYVVHPGVVAAFLYLCVALVPLVVAVWLILQVIRIRHSLERIERVLNAQARRA
jgi:uncharacterized membrane protein